MKRQIVNLDELDLQRHPFPGPERFGGRMGLVAPMLGAQKLGYNLLVLEPGKTAFPFHNHWVNEEMCLVIEGEGEIRIGDARHPLRKGDVVALPPGGRETAHQIINTGSTDMKIFSVSTKVSPEVCEYPDSDKFGLLAENVPGPGGQPRRFMFVSRENLGISYWDGE